MPSRSARRPPGRSPRPAGDLSRATVAVVALAFLLRLAGVGWGIPDGTHFFSFHPDEFETAGRSIRILNTGNWDPEFFNYGSLYLYLTTLLAWPFYALGLVQTITGTHVVERLLSAAAGAATVLVVQRTARRVTGPTFAILAALFVAVAPGAVQHSSFATVDVMATFLVASALHLALRARDGGRARFALAGAVAGLAAGTKYAAGLVLVAPLVAAALGADRAAIRERLLRAGIAVVAALVAFAATTPYAFVTPDLFRDDVRYELLVHPREGHLNIFQDTGNGWTYHLTANLPYVLGLPLLLLSIAGLIVLAASRRPDAFVLLSFAILYFLGLGLSNVRFLRYALPLVPVLAVAAAAVLERFRAADPPRRLLPRVLGGVAAGWAALLVAIQLAALATPDPRTRAAAWTFANVPPGATIGLASVPWFSTPPVTPWNGGERSRRRFETEPAPWRFVLCEDWNVDALQRARPDVFLMSEFDWREACRLRNPRCAAFLAALDRDYEPAARFVALGDGTRRLFGRAFAPHDWLYPYAEVRIWRRRA